MLVFGGIYKSEKLQNKTDTQFLFPKQNKTPISIPGLSPTQHSKRKRNTFLSMDVGSHLVFSRRFQATWRSSFAMRCPPCGCFPTCCESVKVLYREGSGKMTRRVTSDGSDFQQCCAFKNAMMTCWKELSENQVVVCCCEFLHVYIDWYTCSSCAGQNKLANSSEQLWFMQGSDYSLGRVATRFFHVFPWLFPKKKPTNLFNKSLCLGFWPCICNLTPTVPRNTPTNHVSKQVCCTAHWLPAKWRPPARERKRAFSHCWWLRNAGDHQLRLVVYPIESLTMKQRTHEICHTEVKTGSCYFSINSQAPKQN